MKSRISFFDQTLLRKDITRFAPVWILYLIGGLMVGFGVVGGYNQSYYAARSMADIILPLAVVNTIYALIVAECLFGDLFNSRLCNAIHALPLRREQIFATHTVAGLLFGFAPNLVFTLVLMPQLEAMWYVALIWLLAMTLQYLFFFSLAVLSAIVTGNRFAMAAVYVLIDFLGIIVGWFAETFYLPLLPGLQLFMESFCWFSPTVGITQLDALVEFVPDKMYGSSMSISARYRFAGLSGQWWYLVVLAGIGVALLVAAVLLYRKRKLESAGDFLAFRSLAPVCSVVITLAVAAAFRIIMGEITSMPLFSLLVGFLVGCFGAEMLLRRTVKVFDRKTCIKCGLIGVTFALTLGITALDPAGLTRWTPEPEQVVSVTVLDQYDGNALYEYQRPFQTKDRQMIGDLVQIHEQLLTQHIPEGERVHYGGALGKIHLTYQLSDGRTVVRRYCFSKESDLGKQILKIYDLPEFVLGYSDWDAFIKETHYVEVGSPDEYWSFYGDEKDQLLYAIREDILNGSHKNVMYPAYEIRIEDSEGRVQYLSLPYESSKTSDWMEGRLKTGS